MTKFTSPICYHEQLMEKILKDSELILDTTTLTIENSRIILNQGYKLLQKCEELRKSRDNWRNKFVTLKNEI